MIRPVKATRCVHCSPLYICSSVNCLFIHFPKGATIKRDKSTGAIVVARIMRGGAADKSGKLLNFKPRWFRNMTMMHALSVPEKQVCFSNTWKVWSMKEMSWRRWMESRWRTRSQRKSLLFWFVSPLLFGQTFPFFYSVLQIIEQGWRCSIFALFIFFFLSPSNFIRGRKPANNRSAVLALEFRQQARPTEWTQLLLYELGFQLRIYLLPMKI